MLPYVKVDFFDFRWYDSWRFFERTLRYHFFQIIIWNLEFNCMSFYNFRWGQRKIHFQCFIQRRFKYSKIILKRGSNKVENHVIVFYSEFENVRVLKWIRSDSFGCSHKSHIYHTSDKTITTSESRDLIIRLKSHRITRMNNY